MDNKTITDEIYRLMGQIADRTERMATYQGKVPAIELDLVMEETRRLYDCFILLHSRTERDYLPHREDGDEILTGETEQDTADSEQIEDISHDGTDQVTSATEEPLEITEPAGEDFSGSFEDEGDVFPEAEPAVVSDKETSDTLETKPAADLEPEASSTGEREAEVSVPEASSDAHESHITILAEKLGRRKEKKSINDLIAAKRNDVSISSRMQHNPIRDLKSAIGINEKFIYVYELFGGNSQAYAQAIERLNSMGSRDEAIGLMETMRDQYHWDIENMAFQKLVDMVARRYT